MADAGNPLDLPIDPDAPQLADNGAQRRLCVVLTSSVSALFPGRRFVLSAVRAVRGSSEVSR